MDSQEKQTRRRMTRRTKKSLALLCAAAVIIIAAACYTIFIKPAQNVEHWEYSEQTVQHGTLKSGVTESGTVEFGITSQIYDLDVSTDSDDEDDDDDEEDDEKYLKVEEVYVAVGQRVQEGDQVYRFTQDSIDSVRKALTYEKTEAQIALATAQTEYEIGVLEAELSRNETRLDTSLAQTAYDTAIARLSNDMAAKNLEIQQLLKDIYKLQCDLTDEEYLDEKSDILEAYEKAIEGVEDSSEDYVTNKVDAAQTFQSAKTSYEQFFTQFDDSNQQIADKIDEVHQIEEEIVYNQNLLEKELLAAEQSLKTSTVSGEIADVKYQSSLTGYENALSKAQRELEEATEKLNAFDEFVGDGIVSSEGSGIVTEIGYASGDYLTNTATLIAFAKAEEMTVSVDVSQEDVVMMKVGDTVELSFSACTRTRKEFFAKMNYVRRSKMITVEHLTKRYGDFTAVSELSFEIEEGHVYGFLGPNGAGKSTTMNIMTGCLSATEGHVRIDGHDIFEEPYKAKRLLGYLPEQPPLYMNETPLEYLRFVGEAKGIRGRELARQIGTVIEQTRLGDVQNRLIAKLSKGYRQRVGIAQALLGNPKVVILDEPTVGLDPIQIIEIRDLIRQLGREHTVILSSHILSEVQTICEKVLIIAKGKLVAFDEPKNLEKLLMASNTVSFVTEAGTGEVDEILKEIEGVSHWEIKMLEDKRLGVEVQIDSKEAYDICRSIFLAFAEKKKVLLELAAKKANLEDVFIELTEGDSPEIKTEEKAAGQDKTQESEEKEREVADE